MEGARVPRRDDRALRRPQVRTATEEPRSPAPREPSPAAPRRPNMRRNARMFRGRGRAGVRQFLATTRRSPRPCGTQLRTCPPDDRARVFRRHRSDGAGGRSRGPHRDPKRLPKPRSIRARPGGGTARALSTRFPAGEARRATARRAGAGGRARVGIYHSAIRHPTAAEVGEFLRDARTKCSEVRLTTRTTSSQPASPTPLRSACRVARFALKSKFTMANQPFTGIGDRPCALAWENVRLLGPPRSSM